jgi:hypothetical protein
MEWSGVRGVIEQGLLLKMSFSSLRSLVLAAFEAVADAAESFMLAMDVGTNEMSLSDSRRELMFKCSMELFVLSR